MIIVAILISPELLIELLALIGGLMVFSYKTGVLKKDVDKQINDLDNKIQKTVLAESTTNEILKIKVQGLESKSQNDIDKIEINFNKEIGELDSKVNSLYRKISRVMSFLEKTTDFNRKDTNC